MVTERTKKVDHGPRGKPIDKDPAQDRKNPKVKIRFGPKPPEVRPVERSRTDRQTH